jgi:hypothetical protein
MSQEVKEIICTKIKIDEIMPEHKRYTAAKGDCEKV